MGSALEVGKLVCASWLKANWERAPRFMKYYMITAVLLLMLITSMGIFGFLSKAHNDQNLVSGDVQSKIAIYDEKIKTAKDNIDANRKALKQMDEAVDQVMGRSSDEKGAEKAVQIRRSQQKERARLQSEITAEQKIVATVSQERAPIAAEVRKVEAEVGPIKYIAKFIYGEKGEDENMLEQAVTWIIIMIVVVFDPLAVIMLLAAQMTFGWKKDEDEHLLHTTVPHTETPVSVANVDETINQVEEITLTHTEEVPSETPSTALGGDITAPEEKPAEMVEDIPLEQWNKMIEEAEKEVEKEVIEKEARKYQIIPELQKELDKDQGTQFPYNPVEGQVFTRIDFDTPREFTFNGSQWVDSVSYYNQTRIRPDLTEVIEPEDSKKKTYMIKDPTGHIQVKSR
jgi:hypothetical protein